MDYQKLIDYRNAHNPFAKSLGITVTDIGPGRAQVVKTVTAGDLNPVGRAHGGVYYAMADTACGSASSSHGRMAVTVSGSYNYFRSANVDDTLTAEAAEVKSGKTICVYDVRLTDQTGALLGNGSFTFYLLDQALELDV